MHFLIQAQTSDGDSLAPAFCRLYDRRSLLCSQQAAML
jgi:hypothetical protein